MAGLFIIDDPRPNIRETPPLSDATQAGRGNDEARPLNRHVLLVCPGSLLGNSIDLRPGARVIPQEAAKICSTQHEHPAIAERHGEVCPRGSPRLTLLTSRCSDRPYSPAKVEFKLLRMRPTCSIVHIEWVAGIGASRPFGPAPVNW